MADTLVEGAVHASLDDVTGLWGPYWSDASTAIIVFLDTGQDLSYARTTDKGETWSTTEVEAGVVMTLACWYDKETPGNSGTLIHMARVDRVGDGFVYYQTLDVSDGSLGTKRTVDGTVTVSINLVKNRIAITQTVSGNIIVAFSTQTEIECYKSSDNFATAGTDIADVFETATEEDWCLLFPANVDAGDACALFWDRSAESITLKMYDDSADTWTEFATPIASAIADANHMNMDGSVRHSDNHVLVAWHLNDDQATDDVQTADLTVDSIASPTVTAKTNVVTDQAESAQVAVFINQQNDDVYVAYFKGGTWAAAVHAVFRLSTDGMGTWGSEQAYSESLDDHRLIYAGRTVGNDGGRYQPVFYDDDDTNIYINEVNDIEFAASAGAQTLTPSGIASLEAFGAATVTGDLQTITAGAIASAEAFGNAQLNLAFTATGIPSAGAFGGASISTVVTLSPSGIASLEAFGVATISTVVTLSPSGIASDEAFGSATVTAALQTITGAGIASAEAFGSAQLNLAFTASGIASLEAFGAATVTLAGQTLLPSGIASLEAFGAATLSTAVTITASGIASLETFGAATVSAGVIIFSAYGNWKALIDPGDYPVGTEFVFEAIVATNNGNFPSYAHLYNITDEVVVANSQVQSVNTTDERVRSSALSLPAAPKEYRCERGGVAGATYRCYSANVLPKSG